MSDVAQDSPARNKSNASFTSRKMDWINAANRRLAGTPFKVAVCIMRYANQNTEESWPSQDTIAAEIDLSTRTVKRAVRKLVKDRWINRRTVWRDGKSHNVYAINWGNVQTTLDDIAVERIKRGVKNVPSGGVTDGPLTPSKLEHPQRSLPSKNSTQSQFRLMRTIPGGLAS